MEDKYQDEINENFDAIQLSKDLFDKIKQNYSFQELLIITQEFLIDKCHDFIKIIFKNNRCFPLFVDLLSHLKIKY